MLNSTRALKLVGRVCDWVYRRVDQIVVLSPGFKRLLIQRGVPGSKVEVIYNWADQAALMSPLGSLPSNFPGVDRFKIVFAGNMGKAQALDAVLDAAVILQRRGSRVCFVMLGGGVEVARLKERSNALGLGNTFFLPTVPMAEVGILLAAADALLVHLKKDPLFEITIPSKTQAYMCVGKPLLMAVNGDAADLVKESNGGAVAESENPHALAEAAEWLANANAEELTAMGQRAKIYYQKHLALPVGAKRFGEIFRRLGK